MNKPRFKSLVSCILCCAVFISAFSYANITATDISSDDQAKIDDYRQQQQELDQKISETEEILSSLKGDIAQQSEYVDSLTTQVDNYQAQINVLNSSISALELEKAGVQTKIDGLNADIKDIEIKINHNELNQINLQQEIEDIYSELKNRLCDIYMNGTGSELEMLLNCKDFSSFLVLSELTMQIAKHDSAIVDSLNKSIAEIDALNAEHIKLIDSINVKKTDLQVEIDSLNSKQSEIEKSKSSLVASQNKIESMQQDAVSYLSQLDTKSTAYKNMVAKLEADKDAFEKKIDAIANSASKGNGQVSSEGFIWPLQYSDVYISSHFGGRTDPITGIYKTHYATDTCCWSGTYGKSVSATASGTVLVAQWHSSYGYYVMIDHGNGFVSVYAHNSQLLVSVGQTVSQGQIIAYAGSTGYSTGAHVHFEIRLNGTKVDPENYCSP